MDHYYEKIIMEVEKAESILAPNGANDFLQFYYRGQRNAEWELTPSILRPKWKNTTEQEQLERAKGDGAWDLQKPLFENVARMQHYGYPTRFLDYSTSVDIALFFACEEPENDPADGAIFISQYTPDRSASTLDTALITELALLSEEITALNFAKSFCSEHADLVQKRSQLLSEINHRYIEVDDRELAATVLSWIDHGFMVTLSHEDENRMRITDPRIVNQKGAFFAPGNKTIPPHPRASTMYVNGVKIKPEIAELPAVVRPGWALWNTKKIIIPKVWKKGIRKALEEKTPPISEPYIYPD